MCRRPWRGRNATVAAGDRGQEERVRRRAVRRVDLDLADVVEQRVEPGAAEDADLRLVCHGADSRCRVGPARSGYDEARAAPPRTTDDRPADRTRRRRTPSTGAAARRPADRPPSRGRSSSGWRTSGSEARGRGREVRPRGRGRRASAGRRTRPSSAPRTPRRASGASSSSRSGSGSSPTSRSGRHAGDPVARPLAARPDRPRPRGPRSAG